MALIVGGGVAHIVAPAKLESEGHSTVHHQSKGVFVDFIIKKRKSGRNRKLCGAGGKLTAGGNHEWPVWERCPNDKDV